MGTLATAAIARMDEVLPWYRAMPAENRSWVNLVAQAGVAAFVEWFRQPDAPQAISADVFGTAPRELTRSVVPSNLQVVPPVARQQHDPRSQGQLLTRRPSAHQALQLTPLLVAQQHSRWNWCSHPSFRSNKDVSSYPALESVPALFRLPVLVRQISRAPDRWATRIVSS